MIAAYRPEDTTKPSRLNRRRKKRWKKTSLTNFYQAAMLFSLSQKTKAGPSTPKNQGHKRPLFNVVFFMSIKNTGGIAPFVFCYGGLCRAAPKKAGQFLDWC